MEDEEYDELSDIPFADGKSTLGDVIFGNADEEPEGAGKGFIPYTIVSRPTLPLKSSARSVFIPGVPITVRISSHERNVTKHLLNPYLYTIEVSHGPFHWTVYKRYKHFLYLHQQLQLFRAGLAIPFPTDTHRKNRQSFKEDKDVSGPNRGALPRFPKKPEIMIGFDEVDDRQRQLEDYLQNLLNIRFYREHYETILFLCCSPLSFVNDLGIKNMEGLVKKQTGGTQRGCCCGLFECTSFVRFGHIASDLCGCWRERWMIVKDTWLGYIRPRDGALRGVILFDQSFEISSGLYSTGIQVYNMQRRLVFKCHGRRKRSHWVETIKNITSRQGFGFTHRNKNSSFAPSRNNTVSTWFVDGSSYMSAVADAIMRAKEEIYIADWWLSPEIYLKRPSLHGDAWRLDLILQKKACEGVKIFVLLYKEVELALGINSYYSKSRLGKCHKENIKVLRHPDHANSGVFLWAHHEKIVCVDQTYAFLGGIDLCYGRWDDNAHRLTDYGSYIPSSDQPHKKKITSSRPLGSRPRPVATLIQQSNDIGVKTATYPRNSGEEVIEETTTYDTVDELQSEPIPYIIEEEDIVSPSEEKIKCDSPEFQRKSLFRKFQDTVQESKSFLMKVAGEGDEVPKATEVEEVPKATEVVEADEIIHESKVSRTVDQVCVTKYWLGKDYCNFIVKDFCDLDSPYQDLVDRHTTPRMPWHDIGVMVHGAAGRDVARHFIQRWNATKLEKAKKMMCYPYLVPKSYEHFEEPEPTGDGCQHRVNCQVLRSISSWSGGFLDPEMWEESIHEAYITSINKSEHYIYIENQFFISLAKQNPFVKNHVGEALCKRILRAHRDGKKFRVFVVLPLLPGFEGEVGGASGTALRAITHWNYASICRGPDSLLGRLEAQGIPNPREYVSFHGLRTQSVLHGEPVTELIYVHSKLMIIDDRLVICGSANINDRSLIGTRDSEIAVLIQDEDLVEGRMNDESCLIGPYASSLRKRLFAEHLGLLKEEQQGIANLEDPISDNFYHDVWLATSQKNTDIFEEVFHCVPTDRATSFKELQEYYDQMPLLNTDPVVAEEKLSEIKGYIVNMPLNFLKEEILTPNPKSVEGMMPTSLWT